MTPAINFLARRRNLFLLGVVIGSILVSLLIRADLGGDPVASPPTEAFVNAPILPDICAGSEISLRQLKSEAPFRVLFPEHSLASADNVTNIRRCGSGVYMAMFQSGLRFSLQVTPIGNPEEKFRSMDEDYPDMQYGEVRGLPALLTTPSDDETNPADGAVSFVGDRVYFQVIGNKQASLDDLVDVTESLRE